MCSSKKLLAVFDVDGTLNRTEKYAVRAHMEGMKQFGAPEDIINADTVLSIFGMRADDYVKILLPNCDQQTGQEYLRYVEKLEIEYMNKYGCCYDGIEQMLDALHEMGWTTAVCSNAPLKHINHVLNAIGIADKIDVVQHLKRGMDKTGTLAMLLEKEQPELAVMIGDRIYDIQAAKSNGIASIGCLYGFAPQEAEKADYTVTQPIEIIEIAKSLMNT